MRRYAARRDLNEPALIQTAERLGAVWIPTGPFDGWLYGMNACQCGAHGWNLCEIKQPYREGHKNEYTEAQLTTIIKLKERQVPWRTLRTDTDVFALLGARRTA